MPRYVADPLPPDCPWGGFTPPNVDWCEEQLCAWIVNPADTWSNLAYVALGVVMVWRARGGDRPTLSLFGPASIAVGVFSLVYHASYTYMLQILDFAGMFLFCSVLLTANALRFGLPARHRFTLLLGSTALLTAAVPLVSETAVPIQSMVAVLIVLILGQELALRRRERGRRLAYRTYAVALVLLGAAAAASAADVTRIACDPTNHWISGHAVWHVLSAAALYALFLFYERSPSP